MGFVCFNMNSWAAVFLLCGLTWHLASSQPGSMHGNMMIHPDLSCTFEDGFCLWEDLSTSRKLKWEVNPGKEPEFWYRTGPLRDHTTGHGKFLLMDIRYGTPTGIALLESAQIITNKETCLTFWYFMYGYAVGSLTVYKIGRGGEKNEVFDRFGLQGKRWYMANVNTGNGFFRLQIEGTFGGENTNGDIAIDDVSFSYHGCKQDESTLFKYQPRVDCDFENDFCSWFFDKDETIKWRIRTVPSNSIDRNALPPRSNGTSYVEMVTTRRVYHEVTKLRGPTISMGSKKACLSFWYLVNGTGFDTFQINIHDNGKGYYDDGTTIFGTTFKSGPLWLQGFVTLPQRDFFYLAFSVSMDGDQDGNFALDDIQLTQGRPCTEEPESLINCDFEKDFCRWYMKTWKDKGDWLRTKDPTPTHSTGPSHDHTTGDGHYIFLDASNVEEANLYSTIFSVNSSGACLSFWYYMHGADVNTLQLRREGERFYFPEIIWSLKGPQRNKWIRQNISLDAGYNEHLVFTAKRGYFPRGDIALDDISITFGATCESGLEKKTTVPVTTYSEISTVETTPQETTTTPTTTEIPPIETPHLLVNGEINPTYNNSRIELVCQHSEKSVRVKWYRRARDEMYYRREILSGRRGKSLLFDEIHPKDAGFYSCVLYRDYTHSSYDSNEVEINVVPDTRPSPLLEIRYDYGAISVGNPYDVKVDYVVKLVCGDEVDDVEYHWKTTSNAFDSLNFPKDRVLVLNGTQPHHSGVYSCRIIKDVYMTAKSNELNILVKPGRRCDHKWDCSGDNYNHQCKNNRCQCSTEAVIHGRRCIGRPKKPIITTAPSFLEFGIGESFYVVCEADEPAPAYLTYTFKIRSESSNMGSLNILKITNATEKDTGEYSCHISYDGVDSWESKSVYIQIKDFIDLNCDFANDFCVWFQEKETDTANFALAISAGDDHGQDSGPNGPFIQLGASATTSPNKAMLLSPTIDRMALDSCLTFWYRMHGTDVHSLSVWRYIYSENSQRFEGAKLWTVIGDKGDVWFKQTVTVGNGSRLYIAFDAIGQVAIDDITFIYRGGC